MNVRTPVFVYAADPVSQAGIEQILRTDAGVLVLGSDRIDEAAVAVIGVDEVDDEAVRVIAGIQRDGCPRVVVVAGQLDEHAVLAAGDAGALGMLRRSEATAGPARTRRAPRSPPARPACRPTSWHRCSAPCGASARRRDDGGGADCRCRHVSTTSSACSPRVATRPRSPAALSYSERTVKGVIHEVTSRLQLRNRSHVVAFALRNDML